MALFTTKSNTRGTNKDYTTSNEGTTNSMDPSTTIYKNTNIYTTMDTSPTKEDASTFGYQILI